MNILTLKIKSSSACGETESVNDKPQKNMTILDHIEKIVEISIKYGIDKCVSKGKKHFDYVTKKLGINPVQAVIFSHFLEKYNDNKIQISEIADSLKCNMVRIIKYMNECDELEKKKLIRCNNDEDGISYRIPKEVWESLRKHDEFRPERTDNLCINKFFTVLQNIFKERNDSELTYDNMVYEIKCLINQNMHLSFCQKIKSYKLDDNDFILLLRFCDLFVSENDDTILSHQFDSLFAKDYIFNTIKHLLRDGDHTLMERKLIEATDYHGFLDSDAWQLTDLAKKELLFEICSKLKNYKKNLLLHEKINMKKMYYNSRETQEIRKLTSLLQEENFRQIQNRLDGKGMRNGFACLFSGGPGTGKTETVYQIARETKRNILMVDISETKSKWFGESEKKIKEIFDSYRAAVKNSEIAPILLFNEADAIIGKRKEFNSLSRSVDQTENTIQNIILQELENLSGILIATTNLTQNMDSAFERRFLYKIKFDNPCPESRQGIWNTLLPDLPEDSAAELAKRFELSGGQIENIARKLEVDSILNGNGLSMDLLTQYCKDEKINLGNSSEKKIGFGNL